MQACSECGQILGPGTNFCSHCGSKIETNAVITEEESTPSNIRSAEGWVQTENLDFKDSKRKYAIVSIGVIVIIALYLTFSSSATTYTLQYTVNAGHETEEITLYYEYTTPEGEEVGGIFSRVPGCIEELIYCEHTFEVEFEYKGAFQSSFYISCYGCEEDVPTVCIYTLIDGYQISSDCGLTSNPNDDLNFAGMIDNAQVNKQVIDRSR